MPIFSASQLGSALAAFIVLTPAGVGSTDTPPPFTSATEAYREGVTALNTGRTESALPALEYAAGHGVLGAQLKLAKWLESDPWAEALRKSPLFALTERK